MTTQPKPASPLVVNLFLFVCFIIGVAIVVSAFREIEHAGALGDGSVRVNAAVTASRVLTYRKRGDSHDVRYTFEVGGRTYSYKDSTGREDLWAEITQDAFEAARRDGTVEVEYLSTDPWVNRPVHAANEGLFGKVAGMVVGFFCMAPMLMAIVGALRGRSKPA